MLIVKKFGGTSVADKERILHVAGICAEEYSKGDDVVVVLSAMGKQTDVLLTQAEEINPNAPKREIDMLLTTGEQISVALMAMALESRGVPAISFHAFQAGIYTTRAYGNARIQRIDTARMEEALAQRKVVIVAGFQGISEEGDYTTLGRGGSDTTAVALAAVLKADVCEIFTDVDGVYTADPRLVPEAVKLKEITYDEMLELASLGAGVLHNRSVELAKRFGVELIVKSSFQNAEGTRVCDRTRKKETTHILEDGILKAAQSLEGTTMEEMLVSGVTADKNAARIQLKGIKETTKEMYKIFVKLSEQHIGADSVLMSPNSDNTTDISFTVPRDRLKETAEVLNLYSKEGSSDVEIKIEDKIAKVSAVGAGMMSNPAIAVSMFEALYEADITIEMIYASELRITVLVNEEDTLKAIRAIHGHLIERPLR
ncbi:aspartate kinase [Anaerocolumna xylanovorans]|uniref:Aspartokinase n=1 Tax=Anaerocolumna xylanovorans DSM 12503 TaxID=1121345 RepID=A0A1M7YA52_9FIRM|nr:aspartate kinase [Anaerocolumna xylanovorans]SHO49512.1 aspartate kinase [Anaerocolumna xylanovorans DSM 12503]